MQNRPSKQARDGSDLHFSNPLDVAELKRIFGVLKKPSKESHLREFGQNFLIDGRARDDIIAAAQVTRSDQVLEIGPGSGVLTQQLATRAGRVVALDVDPYLLEVTRLATVQPDGSTPSNVELLLQDVRKVNLPDLFPEGDYIVVSNIPYYLSGYLFELFTTTKVPPKRLVLTVQKEVAQRVTAGPKDQTILSVVMALFGRASIVREIESGAFWPAPNVDSAVLVIERHATPVVDPAETKQIMRVVKAGFSARRKNLANALAGGLALPIDQTRLLVEQAGFSPTIRAQELSLQDWALLSQKIAALDKTK